MSAKNIAKSIFAGAATFGVCFYAHANFTGNEVNEIIRQNPQLSTVAELPKGTTYTEGDKCRHFNERMPGTKGVLNGVTFNHVCISGNSTSAAKSWERDYGKSRFFLLVLHPETPRVWRVYETPTAKSDPIPIIEFDRNGQKVGWSGGNVGSSILASPQTTSQLPPVNGSGNPCTALSGNARMLCEKSGAFGGAILGK
ncbi:MAG: hypothetical protein Q8L56_02455 [Rhodocyclaceae bacterium]|nr:hypothetical protein [Rhodocyclaceae bacterium]